MIEMAGHMNLPILMPSKDIGKAIVFHENLCLLPLSSRDPETVWWDVQLKIDQYLIDSGQVIPEIANGVE
jgi:hypothetical protein